MFTILYKNAKTELEEGKIQMKNILVVDVQKGYIEEKHKDFLKNLNKYLKGNQFNTMLYTRFVTNRNEDDYKNINMFGLYDKNQRKLAVTKLQQGKVINKKCHGLTPAIIKHINEQNVKAIELCGIDNNGSITLIANQLKRNGIEVTPLNELIISGKKQNEKKYFDAGEMLFKSFKGFYVGDICSSQFNNFSDCTIFTFATIEWLLQTKHTPQDFQKILVYYFKLFPNKNNIYSPEFLRWLENGCKTYILNVSFNAAKISLPIGVYANCLQEVDDLIEKCLCVSSNTLLAKECAKVLCYAVWLLKFGTSKKDLLDKLNNFFDYEFTSDFDQNCNLFCEDPSAINFARLVLSAFVTSVNFEDALQIAQKCKVEKNSVASATCFLAEIYYRNVPANLLKPCRAILPEKFKKLLSEFGKFYNEKIY